MVRWFAYIVVFSIAAFVMHFVVESVTTLVIGIFDPGTAPSVAGPFVLVADFALAGLITWLIYRSGLQFTRTEEDKRRGEEFLEEEHRRFAAAEQQHADELRLERLMAEVARWRQARDLRAYASEALGDLGSEDVVTSDGASLRDELEWALTYADRIDPLRSSLRE